MSCSRRREHHPRLKVDGPRWTGPVRRNLLPGEPRGREFDALLTGSKSPLMPTLSTLGPRGFMSGDRILSFRVLDNGLGDTPDFGFPLYPGEPAN